MNTDLLILALVVGGANWVFRVLPTRMPLAATPPDGRMARFLAAIGPAAIATLFVASILPSLAPDLALMTPPAAGIVALLVVFHLNRSVVAATLAGSVGYGVAFAAVF